MQANPSGPFHGAIVYEPGPELPPDPLHVPGTMERPRLPSDLQQQMDRLLDALDYATRKAERLARESWGNTGTKSDPITARPLPDGFRAYLQPKLHQLQAAIDGICEPGLDLGYYDLADVKEGEPGCTGWWDGIYPEQRAEGEVHPAVRHRLIPAQRQEVAA